MISYSLFIIYLMFFYFTEEYLKNLLLVFYVLYSSLCFIWHDLIGAAIGIYMENVPNLSFFMKRQTATTLQSHVL